MHFWNEIESEEGGDVPRSFQSIKGITEQVSILLEEQALDSLALQIEEMGVMINLNGKGWK